jgi:hypothetical protein
MLPDQTSAKRSSRLMIELLPAPVSPTSAIVWPGAA